MRASRLFGSYIASRSWLHRLSVGHTYLLVLVPTLASLLLRQWWAAVALCGFAVVLLLTSKISARHTLRLPLFFVLMAVAVSAYGFIAVDWRAGLTTLANIVGALLLSRVLTMTTPGAELVDALCRVARPADRLTPGASERFGLTVAVMVRAIPQLLDAFTVVRDAARARGIERRIDLTLTPVVISAVGQAQRTGEALLARGLGDEPVGSGS